MARGSVCEAGLSGESRCASSRQPCVIHAPLVRPARHNAPAMTEAVTRSEPFAFVRELATRWDAIAIIVVIGLLAFFAEASRGLLEPLSKLTAMPLSLAPSHLPVYAARTTL